MTAALAAIGVLALEVAILIDHTITEADSLDHTERH